MEGKTRSERAGSSMPWNPSHLERHVPPCAALVGLAVQWLTGLPSSPLCPAGLNEHHWLLLVRSCQGAFVTAAVTHASGSHREGRELAMAGAMAGAWGVVGRMAEFGEALMSSDDMGAGCGGEQALSCTQEAENGSGRKESNYNHNNNRRNVPICQHLVHSGTSVLCIFLTGIKELVDSHICPGVNWRGGWALLALESTKSRPGAERSVLLDAALLADACLTN